MRALSSAISLSRFLLVATRMPLVESMYLLASCPMSSSTPSLEYVLVVEVLATVAPATPAMGTVGGMGFCVKPLNRSFTALGLVCSAVVSCVESMAIVPSWLTLSPTSESRVYCPPTPRAELCRVL